MNRREWLIAAVGASIASCGKMDGNNGFQESDSAGINPERGFYQQVAVESATDFKAIRASGLSMILLTVDLKRFRDRLLADADLERLDFALKSVREAGLKVIFRAAYGFTDNDYRADPQDLGIIREHIARIAEVLSQHEPVVWAVQAGMLGPWGEWHGSTHGDTPSLEARNAVVDAWLNGLPESVFIQIRRPRFIREMYPFADDPRLGRVGWHNDAMLALPADMGTYDAQGWSRAKELAWSNNQARKTPFGGETVSISEGTPPQQVLRELKLLRITYLNQGYHQGTLDGWKAMKVGGENLFKQVEKSLGYGWVVRALKKTENSKISLEIENTGFAPIYTSRKLEAAWLDPKSFEVANAAIDIGVNLKGLCSEDGRVRKSFDLPGWKEGLVPGLRIPDSHETIREDGRYAVRFMNKGIQFDESSGWNILG